MSYNCKYCNLPENKQLMSGLVCDVCKSFVHLSCLQRPGTPGNLEGDIFFDFTCKECSESEKEVFTRNKFPWVNVIFLTLHHLSHRSLCISNNGYFHYKTHISTFIDRNWTLLFGEKSKQKKNWVGTIAGALSVYSNLLFKSGSAFLGEAGWWKLQHSFTPAVAVHILAEVVKDKPKGLHRTQLSLEQRLFIKKVTNCGYGDLLTKEEAVPETPLVPAKKRKLEFDETSRASGSSYYEMVDSDSRDQLEMLTVKNERIIEQYDDLPLHRNNSYSDMESVFKGFIGNSSEQVLQSESSSVRSYDYTTNDFYDSDSRSRSPHLPSSNQLAHQAPVGTPDKEKPDKSTNKSTKSVDKPIVRRENRFCTLPNSVDMPWLEPEPQVREKNVTEMTQYEEAQLLKKVIGLIPKVKDPNKKAYLYRLKGKLALRRLKRQRHMPIFDLDKTVKILGGYLSEEKETTMNAERVLDRFQRSYLLDNLCGTIADRSYSIQLLANTEAAPFRSTYSNTLLKPYIRRDHETTPLWLKLTNELLRKANSKVEDYEPPPHATIDYSYVRPHHIAAVNNLCAQFFWPGIDMTEALQYPEMSCVVSYKKIVIGCAFLVPDVGPNEAYIPFVLTRPEWRNAGIATFMLYHLLQTCIGQDVTLHVSPTNTAIFMYQKFGFKTEEMVQDFYEKYFDIDYKGCRHALFLRLVR